MVFINLKKNFFEHFCRSSISSLPHYKFLLAVDLAPQNLASHPVNWDAVVVRWLIQCKWEFLWQQLNTRILQDLGIERITPKSLWKGKKENKSWLNNNNNEVLIKLKPLVLPELSLLNRKKRKKKRLKQYNSNNKLIRPWTVHQQIQPTSYTHTHTHTEQVKWANLEKAHGI